jgi:hypothetical protein
VIVFVYGTRKIYLKVYQGKSNTLTSSYQPVLTIAKGKVEDFPFTHDLTNGIFGRQ